MENMKNKVDKLRERRIAELKAKGDEKRAKQIQKAKAGKMKAIKKGGMTPADYAKLSKKGPAKY